MITLVLVAGLLFVRRDLIIEYVRDSYEFDVVLGTCTLLNLIFSVMAIATLMFLFEVYGIYIGQLIASSILVYYVISIWRGVSR